MATVYQRRKNDGTLAKTFSADLWVNGDKFQRSTGCKTRREAEKKAAELEEQLRQELARQYEPMTLDKCMGRYWRDHASDLPSAPSVKYHIERLLEIIGGDIMLADLSNADVHRYVTTRSRMPVSRSTVNRELDVLQSAYCMARDRWEHPVRPIRWRDHRFPAGGKRKAILNLDEASRAVALLSPRSRDMADAVELTVYTGMRKNELETLTKARVDLPNRKATVLAKRKARQDYRERDVFLSTAAVAMLVERIATDIGSDVPLFNLKNGRKLWEWVRAEIGRPDVRWHDLRHTHASMLGEATKDPKIVQHQLGHTHIETSMDYIHTADAKAIEAVEMIPALTDRAANGNDLHQQQTPRLLTYEAENQPDRQQMPPAPFGIAERRCVFSGSCAANDASV